MAKNRRGCGRDPTSEMQTRALVFLALAAAASAFTAPAMGGRMQLRSSKAGEGLCFCGACAARVLRRRARTLLQQPRWRARRRGAAAAEACARWRGWVVRSAADVRGGASRACGRRERRMHKRAPRPSTSAAVLCAGRISCYTAWSAETVCVCVCARARVYARVSVCCGVRWCANFVRSGLHEG